MTDILNKTIALVLNRNWQAIHVRTPQEAFCMMATNVATALEIDGDDHIRPVTWDEWITLPVRSQDNAVQTVRGPIRVPTVIVAVNFARVPKKRPKLCAKTIRERDGNRCQYTASCFPRPNHYQRSPNDAAHEQYAADVRSGEAGTSTLCPRAASRRPRSDQNYSCLRGISAYDASGLVYE